MAASGRRQSADAIFLSPSSLSSFRASLFAGRTALLLLLILAPRSCNAGVNCGFRGASAFAWTATTTGPVTLNGGPFVTLPSHRLRKGKIQPPRHRHRHRGGVPVPSSRSGGQNKCDSVVFGTLSSDEENVAGGSSRDPSAAESDADATMTARHDVIRALDEAFDYEGRMSSTLSRDGEPSDDDEDEKPANVSPSSPGDEDDGGDFRFGFVSIVGAPNMGKSTLLNALIGEDLCVATRRPQTTRHAILGVLTDPLARCQLAFFDTPGVIDDPAYKLQEGMMEAVRGAMSDADVLLVVTDVFSTPIPSDEVFERVRKTGKPVVVAVNKIDLAARATIPSPAALGDDPEAVEKTYTLEDAVQRWRALLPDAVAIVPVCATRGDEVDEGGGAKKPSPTPDPGLQVLRLLLVGGPDVAAAVRDLGRPIRGMFRNNAITLSDQDARRIVPRCPPMYGEDALTDRSERFFASEMIRASLFETLKKEVPYCCEVRVEEFKEPMPEAESAMLAGGGDEGKKKRKRKKSVIRIKAVICVERDSQKGIVVGRGGQQIKSVGINARRRLEECFGQNVHLELNVKVDRDWRKSEARLKQYGYLK